MLSNSSLTDVQFIPCNFKAPTIWRPGSLSLFSSRTRSLSPFSLQSSSSSTATSPFIVRSSHFVPRYTYPSNFKVKVWWDFDTCELPTGVSVSEVAPIISAALKANGINGPIESIRAFGNMKNLSIENQEAISSSGIDFNQVEPKGMIDYSWIDFDKCELPTGVSVSEVAPIISAVLKANGINGPIESIRAFGNMKNLSIENQESISSSGIDFYHVEPKDQQSLNETGGRQNGVYRAIVSDCNRWATENEPPCHLFFITGYDNLGGYYSDMRKFEKYHVLVASTGPEMEYLCSFANMAWDWKSLVRGEQLIGHRRN